MNPEFDPRLPEVYDAENVWGADDDFFLAVARRGERVLDLGCGTGRLTIAIAQAGCAVTGIDPNPASLDYARRKPDADRVTWILGTSRDAPAASVDVVLMTSHVANVFVDDGEWHATLADARRALVPGGVLAFDSWNPQRRPWEHWTERATRGHYELSGGRSVDTWVEVDTVEDDIVTFTWANEFSDGAFVGGRSSLRCRTEEQLRADVLAAGFADVSVSPEIVVVATA